MVGLTVAEDYMKTCRTKVSTTVSTFNDARAGCHSRRTVGCDETRSILVQCKLHHMKVFLRQKVQVEVLGKNLAQILRPGLASIC